MSECVVYLQLVKHYEMEISWRVTWLEAETLSPRPLIPVLFLMSSLICLCFAFFFFILEGKPKIQSNQKTYLFYEDTPSLFLPKLGSLLALGSGCFRKAYYIFLSLPTPLLVIIREEAKMEYNVYTSNNIF